MSEEELEMFVTTFLDKHKEIEDESNKKKDKERKFI
jgi:hypothetical protein